MRRRALAVAGALVALLALPAGAAAHATLVGTAPARGATLEAQPRQVVLRFSETVEANFGAVRVFDARARRVDDGRTVHPGGAGARLAVGLRPRLADGTYVATYRVISADGHPVSGGLVFSIGAPGATAAPSVAALIGDQEAGAATQIAFGVARGASYLATALLLGGLAFLLAVWLPALRSAAGPGGGWGSASAGFLARLRALLAGAAALGVLAGAAGIVLQGATAAGTSGWSALDGGVIGDVLGTRFGEVWALRIAALALLGAVVTVLLRGPRDARAEPTPPAGDAGGVPRDAGAGPGGAPVLHRVALGADGLAAPGPPRAALALAAVPAAYLAFAPGLAGHAGVTSPVAAVVSLDAAHVLAMSAWIGGLVVLLAAVPAATRRLAPPERTRLLAGTLARFSPVALGCVAVLLLTGTIQAVVHVGAWDRLLDTGFGRAVVVKAGLLALLVVAGAVNRRRVLPALRRLAAGDAAPGAAGRLLRRTLRTEVALAVAVLGVSAALVSYPPPDSLAGGPFAGDAALGPLRLEATVDPARVGPNEVHLYVLKASDGTPFAGTRELTVTLALPGRGIGPIGARARTAGPGHYVVDTVQLVPGGDWRLTVTSRVSEFDEYTATLPVPVR